MKVRKNILALLIVIGLLLAGCTPGGAPAADTPAVVNVGGLKGPTGMALVGMADAARRGEARHGYRVTFDAAPDIIQGKILSGELDIAVLPTNLAALLHSRTEGEITMIALSRLSVLHIMQQPGVDIRSFADLRGKTLYTAGQGSTQEFVLSFLLYQAGLDPEHDLNVVFQPEHAHVVALMLDGRADAALLPQPFVSTLSIQNPEITRALDINAEWEAVTGGIELAMSCVVVRTDFLEHNRQIVLDFLEDYAQSARFAMTDIERAAELIGEFEIIPQAVALVAIPYSNIDSVSGEEMKVAAQAYLRVLYEQNPAAVGGRLPDESFFFIP